MTNWTISSSYNIMGVTGWVQWGYHGEHLARWTKSNYKHIWIWYMQPTHRAYGHCTLARFGAFPFNHKYVVHIYLSFIQILHRLQKIIISFKKKIMKINRYYSFVFLPSGFEYSPPPPLSTPLEAHPTEPCICIGQDVWKCLHGFNWNWRMNEFSPCEQMSVVKQRYVCSSTQIDRFAKRIRRYPWLYASKDCHHHPYLG